MPLSIGKMTVNVSLCGAIPRSEKFPPVSSSDAQPRTLSQNMEMSAHALRENITTFDLNKQGARKELAPTHSRSLKCFDRSKTLAKGVLSGDNLPHAQPSSQEQHQLFISSPAQFLSKTVSQSEDSEDTITTVGDHPVMPRLASARPQSIPVIEPPRWAVPAKGGARLEPVCEALGTHVTVDLASRPCFRIGRSPTSDVQLMHGTSSRRHALLFHHPNGHCYVVDCGSAHGTFVNGVRVRSTPSAGMVAPHRVRRGALIRFGGPGAPSFVLKSFSVGFSYMVKDLESPSCHPTLSPSPEKRKQVRVHTGAANAFGNHTGNNNEHHCTTTVTIGGGILKKRSFDDLTDESQQGPAKRRCVSPVSPESSPRLVSPEGRRVTFNDVPQAFYPSLVSPDLSSDDASL